MNQNNDQIGENDEGKIFFEESGYQSDSSEFSGLGKSIFFYTLFLFGLAIVFVMGFGLFIGQAVSGHFIYNDLPIFLLFFIGLSACIYSGASIYNQREKKRGAEINSSLEIIFLIIFLSLVVSSFLWFVFYSESAYIKKRANDNFVENFSQKKAVDEARGDVKSFENEKLNNSAVASNQNDFEKENEISHDSEGEEIQDTLLNGDNSISGWKEYVNKNDGYSISFPSEFFLQGSYNIMNYDINDPKYDRGNPDGIKIQIQKHKLHSDYDSIVEYKQHLMQSGDRLVNSAETCNFGDSIDLCQYTKNGPGGAFMSYVAFEENDNIYYNILVFEPGYSKNKNYIESIIETFTVL